jgi:hypothetical protein
MSNTKPKPGVENNPPLRDWLNKHNAKCIWQHWDSAHSIEGWTIAGNLFIINIYSDNRGWDIYTGQASIDVTDTLKDAEKRLGIQQQVQEVPETYELQEIDPEILDAVFPFDPE